MSELTPGAAIRAARQRSGLSGMSFASALKDEGWPGKPAQSLVSKLESGVRPVATAEEAAMIVSALSAVLTQDERVAILRAPNWLERSRGFGLDEFERGVVARALTVYAERAVAQLSRPGRDRGERERLKKHVAASRRLHALFAAQEGERQ